ncbi:MAG: DNA polymerase III subunit gamma/tau [Oscillospiraceae bacterium]|nr:DNA polymerase III subunit gamma/tau [Candidatus Equicaccousia limihippi]
MYQALYRKYRPLTFSDVSGQETVTKTLQNAVKTGRVSHAYLFTGIRGTGKTTCAKVLAKAVNCLNPIDGNPCGECENCKAVQNGATDIIELDAASNNGVEYVRELREQVGFLPAVLKYRVYIIDEVHMLSINAFNALLKTLEEPPEHVIFILATTEINKIPATILSRCQRYDFKRISFDKIVERLFKVSQSENINLTPGGAQLIASLSDGGLRDALSLLDLCASLSDTVDEQTVQNACGNAAFDNLCEMVGYIAAKDSDGVFSLSEKLYREGTDMKVMLSDLLDFFRNIMIIKTAKNPAPLTGLVAERFEKTAAFAKDFSLEYILYCMDTVGSVKPGQNPKIDAQMCLVKLLYPESCDSGTALAARVERLENGGVAYRKAETPKTEPAKAQTENTPSKPPKQETAQTQKPQKAEPTEKTPTETAKAEIKEGKLKEWQSVLNLLKTKNRPLFGVLYNSAAYFEDGRVLIDSPLSSFREMINSDPATKESLKKAIADVYGKAYPIGPYKKAEGSASEPQETVQNTEQKTEDTVPDSDEPDPLIGFNELAK